MKVIAQVYTEKGFYGEQISMNVPSVSEISEMLLASMASLPDELEGEKFVNWTKISIEVERTPRLHSNETIEFTGII